MDRSLTFEGFGDTDYFNEARGARPSHGARCTGANAAFLHRTYEAYRAGSRGMDPHRVLPPAPGPGQGCPPMRAVPPARASAAARTRARKVLGTVRDDAAPLPAWAEFESGTLPVAVLFVWCHVGGWHAGTVLHRTARGLSRRTLHGRSFLGAPPGPLAKPWDYLAERTREGRRQRLQL